jgi:hypothetical protein
MISGEKRCARRWAQWTALTERSEKSTGNKILASGTMNYPLGAGRRLRRRAGFHILG